MYLFGKISVIPEYSPKLDILKSIAYNLWWTWNEEYTSILKEINNDLFIKSNKNPIRFLKSIGNEELNAALSTNGILDKYINVINKFHSYMKSENTWFQSKYPDKNREMIAYFSAEYGLHELIPVYSGGLGVLSADHCKTASDMGLPFVAVGLLYKKGYFSQHINSEGWPVSTEQELQLDHLPIIPVKDCKDKDIIILIEFPNRNVYVKIWRLKVGRVDLYLLDTDIEQNNSRDRNITYQLYGGNQETRITQEIILGIGGIRALRALNIKPSVYHLNEGHSAFICIELIKEFMQNENLTIEQAVEAVRSCTVFTTHTPVPAGSDLFPVFLIDKYFSDYLDSAGIKRKDFLRFGLALGWDGKEVFNMTVLALKLSGKKNGVSKLHGMVSRNIFNHVWQGIPEEEVPIQHITNGVHTYSWISGSFNELFNKYMGMEWIKNSNTAHIWKAIDEISDKEIWHAHMDAKIKMTDYLNSTIDMGISNNRVKQAAKGTKKIASNALIIGFARRFATYKRAELIFDNMERITRILNNKDYPVLIVFSGKAHPADHPAHKLIKKITDYSKQENLSGKIFFIEDYNMEIARHMIQGVDLWLNNPRKPLEASGTSGQKAALNGIPNLSVSDGWWVEGYNGKNGWVIGDEEFHTDRGHQDMIDSESLYTILESEIIPLFFHRNPEGIPEGWIQIMRESIKSTGYNFSTFRMLEDYTAQMYMPSIERTQIMQRGNYTSVKNLNEWKNSIISNWHKVNIHATHNLKQTKYNIKPGDTIHMECILDSGGIDPSHLKVEVYYGKFERENFIEESFVEEMKIIEQKEPNKYKYGTDIVFNEEGQLGYTYRVTPYNSNMINRHETGLIKWVE